VKVSRVFCAPRILFGVAGYHEAIYSNMPVFGLAKATTEHVQAVGAARRRDGA
jgi:hypothetical protein